MLTTLKTLKKKHLKNAPLKKVDIHLSWISSHRTPGVRCGTLLEVLTACGEKQQLALVRGKTWWLIMVSHGTQTPVSQVEVLDFF